MRAETSGGQMEDLDLLVDAARAGGGWAFARLWEVLSPVVASYLRGRGTRDPEDVASEVFLAAFQRIGRFDGDGAAFRAWLFTIAHHKGVDALRRGPNREVLMEELDDGRRHPSAEDTAIGRLGEEAALRRLDVLTDDQRAVILLRVVGDLSLAETALILGKPVGAIKALQHRALERLRTRPPRPAVSPGAARPMTGTR
ncbi:MAG: RNA polymerase sigma factor [Spirochaetaceae bacterium]|nr:RNA polymerase sigma factor [Spirochaetaceae bacterium]